MNINIDNKLVIIIGPSSMGKSTLAKKMQDDFDGNAVIISHDDILEQTDKNQDQDSMNLEFRLRFFDAVGEAVHNKSNDLVILDTLNFNAQALFAVLMYTRRYLNYMGGITVIKMNLPLDLHKKYIEGHKALNPLVDVEAILGQRVFYESQYGSLNCPCTGLANKIIKINNPEDVKINYNLKKRGNKKSK